MITKEILGMRIKAAREKKGWTQKKLAGMLDLDSKSISNYERGENFPAIGTLNDLSRVLQYPMEYFLSVEPKMSIMARLYYLQERFDEIKEELNELQELLRRM
jgi:transcriptional regulator with XRE-family HTH domain